MSNKYKSPYPDKQITGNDFNELVDFINSQFENNDESIKKLNSINEKVEILSDKIKSEEEELNQKLKENELTLNKISNLDKRIDNFYSKIIEIVGIFIAIFSFIIAGIQISFKLDGTYEEIAFKSISIFGPLTVCIIILLLFIKIFFRK
ncbi:MAG: hypothetical protein LBM67_02810 [Lentimicrobiaceae bacterium]|jgi:HD-GYP domain-containing protein (c-di-GMP phosphodiesterase class II)|nr:hypothetical protein [Lentimicrobiaceae bacterium]